MLQHKVRFVGLPDVLIKSKSKICLGISSSFYCSDAYSPSLWSVL